MFFDAVGCPVLLAVADPDQYTGERAPAQIDPDAPGLPWGDDPPGDPDQPGV